VWVCCIKSSTSLLLKNIGKSLTDVKPSVASDDNSDALTIQYTLEIFLRWWRTEISFSEWNTYKVLFTAHCVLNSPNNIQLSYYNSALSTATIINGRTWHVWKAMLNTTFIVNNFVKYPGGEKSLQFLTEITVYLGNIIIQHRSMISMDHFIGSHR